MQRFVNPHALLIAASLGFLAIAGGVIVLTLPGLVPNPLLSGGKHPHLATFASCTALREKIRKTAQEHVALQEQALGVSLAAPQAAGAPEAQDYTRTNVQVEGVDEADIVKTDGTYLYLLSKDQLRILRATPPQDTALLATVSFHDDTPQELFLDGNMVAVFGQRSFTPPEPEPLPKPLPPVIEGQRSGSASGGSGVSAPAVALPDRGTPAIYPEYSSLMFIELYDVSDKTKPNLVRTVEFRASYLTSRKINDMMYVVVQSAPEVMPFVEGQQESEANKTDDAQLVPQYREAAGAIDAKAAFAPVVSCSSIAYPPVLVDGQYLTVLGLSMRDPGSDVFKKVLLGAGSTVYASAQNLYVAGVDYGYFAGSPRPLGIMPAMPIRQSVTEETIVHSFSLGRDAITYRGEGKVPGQVLNQFSMDEDKGYFRIATTMQPQWVGPEETQQKQSTNAVYILDGQLKRVGAVEDLAPGETIYSARFMGERAYLVTFKKTDPFFVLDLSDPQNPGLLGKLKVPGFSDYLHPYDATHIIGVGKNAEDAPESDFAWYQGMKLALFDVSNPEDPKELFTTDIGDRGTDSPALHDHKAFLFDPSRNLLVLPILLAQISDSQKAQSPSAWLRVNQYGDFVFQGSYVYELTLEKGFVLRGRITHFDDPVAYFQKTGYYPGESDFFVQRNLRIGDNLYSISDGKVMVNALGDLHEVSSVSLP